MKRKLSLEIHNIKGIKDLTIEMVLQPDLYAITGINGIGKSTLLSCITPRLKRPISFNSLIEATEEDSSIKYEIDGEEEVWRITNSQWECIEQKNLPMRGFQEGSLTNGTRFFNISSLGFRYYKQLLNVDTSLLVPADEFVKENLGAILQNDKSHYVNLYRLDRSKAERRYKYKGVVYYLKIKDRFISQFELSTGEFLLINLLHLFNNLLVRTNNIEKLNLILVDEVELALHPSAIKRLVDFSKGIAVKYSVAIYFSTHSLEIINGLPIDNLFYLHLVSPGVIKCDNPCYPAYITRDIYTHSGYDVLILVEDDLAQLFVNRYISKNHLDYNKRIQVLPVGGYVNTLDLHQNFLMEEVLTPVSHIISIVDGDAKNDVNRKQINGNQWKNIPDDSVLFLPIASLEKYIKIEIFDKRNYMLMRLLRDRLFKFETEVNWYEEEYRANITNKRKEEAAKGKSAKNDLDYFTNGKNLFSVLSTNYESYGHSRKEFREAICNVITEFFDATQFELQLGQALDQILKH